jgi:hypothetical protein
MDTMTTPWIVWQVQVLEAVRLMLCELVAPLDLSDIDWDAFRPFYEQGRSPQAAVDRAFERDL